ncbi:MAG TPA: TIGR02302 family protein [Rhizobiaceae bacterium]|nr:TIGR02302 family protein [Rhizobiaceae bacterium]
MAETPSKNGTGQTPLRVRHTRLATQWMMVFERLWPKILPFLVVASLFVSFSWLGVFRLLPDWPRLALAILFALAAIAALVPLRGFRMPSAGEVDRRIESANRLEHTPLLAQTEEPAGGESAFADALWREHQRRMAARLENIGGDLPRARVPERDPWGLRSIAALLLVVAFAFSWSPISGRLSDAFHIHIARDAVPPRIDAWITPPAYTGRAPIFLTAENAPADQSFSVPENSRLTLRITGGAGDEKLDFKGRDGKSRAIKARKDKAAASTKTPVTEFADTLTANGALSLVSDGRELNYWAVTIIPDRPPVIHFSGDPKQAANGTLELAYTIDDDYGATSAKAEIVEAKKPAPGAHPLYAAPDLPLVLPSRDAKNHAARTSKDLTDHPWAGTLVHITLTAKDAAGHEARSETKTMILPERPFTNPLARALVEQRRILALDANGKPRVLDMMDAVTLRPEDTFPNMGQYLAIMSARSRLQMAHADDAYRDVVAYLWQIALGIENGNLSDAEKKLRQAEQALQQALDRGASDQEIDRLMNELRQAMQNYLREFAERAEKNPNLSQQMPPNARIIRPGDLKRLLDEIQNLAKSGSRDKAQQLLSQLQNMMNNLQAGRGGQQQNGEQGQMRKKMDQLGDLMRRQQEMMNKTFNLGQQQNGEEGQQGENGQQGQAMTPDQLSEALRKLQQGQGKLQKDLQDLMKGLNNMGIKPGQGFGEADDAMGRAGKALGQAEGDNAAGEQGNALQALRRGAQDMMRQMQQAMQGQQGGSGQGGREQNADRDPLGRPRATNGPEFGDSVKIPDEIDVQRARQILDAIRKRLGNALSPELEKSYLERLLNMN